MLYNRNYSDEREGPSSHRKHLFTFIVRIQFLLLFGHICFFLFIYFLSGQDQRSLWTAQDFALQLWQGKSRGPYKQMGKKLHDRIFFRKSVNHLL